MSDNTFEVIFSGELSEGAAPEQVKGNVAALFKVEVARVERLFSGATVAIKKGLDEATAQRYRQALLQAGAICQVVNRAAVPPADAPARPAVEEDSSALGLQKSVVKAAPTGLGELDGASVDAPGVILVEHREVAAPQIDTSQLSLDQTDAELTQHEEVAPPRVDLSALSMGEPGEILVEAEPVEVLEVEFGELHLDEPGVTLVEHEEVPKPQIDTSKLSLD
ncbi:MAG: hypothetical protein OQL08_05480 [Gammaproteobacteria bacterium]|nr:hypothetical protein [Gammaproteobacteria bacterium]